jgi:hypothetical protein
MLRLAEAALFVAPLVLFLCWRFLSRRAGPSTPVVVGILVALALGGAALVWFGLRQGAAPGVAYHPATLDAGRVVPGRLGK